MIATSRIPGSGLRARQLGPVRKSTRKWQARVRRAACFGPRTLSRALEGLNSKSTLRRGISAMSRPCFARSDAKTPRAGTC